MLSWVKDRFLERTSWDGAALIAVGVVDWNTDQGSVHMFDQQQHGGQWNITQTITPSVGHCHWFGS